MSNIKVGFARLDITPRLGHYVSGYYEVRYAKEVLDSLNMHAIAFSNGENKAIILNYDLIDLPNKLSNSIREAVSQYCDVPFDAVFANCTHTHTGPHLSEIETQPDEVNEQIRDYNKNLVLISRDCAKFAFDDLKPAKFYVAEGEAKDISFVRRYRMKDGGVQTNPGVGNAEIDHVLDKASEAVKVIEIKRCGGDDIYLVNFGVHADVIGGDVISADFPRFVRESIEGALGGVKCVFLNGAEGDVNHIKPFPTESDRQGLNYDSFDNVPRGYEHSKHMGRVIAGAALAVCTKAIEVDADIIGFGTKPVSIPSNMENDKLEYAKHISDMVKAGRQDELPYKKMELTTAKAEAARILRLKDGPEFFNIKLTCLRFGDIAFVGLPGEPFTGLGRQIIAASPFDTTVVCCLTNGDGYYYPTTAAYDEGGYEVKSSPLKKGVAEIITNAIVDILNEIK
ncbi:MAG: hypothetical protein IKJ68_04030 [Clostridia bacterium]|nr:hypothetical protein [Clostridia bacterium]